VESGRVRSKESLTGTVWAQFGGGENYGFPLLLKGPLRREVITPMGTTASRFLLTTLSAYVKYHVTFEQSQNLIIMNSLK